LWLKGGGTYPQKACKENDKNHFLQMYVIDLVLLNEVKVKPELKIKYLFF